MTDLTYTVGVPGEVHVQYHDADGKVVDTPATTNWTSSDPNILTLRGTDKSSAEVTALAAGTADITASVDKITDPQGITWPAYSGTETATVAPAMPVIASCDMSTKQHGAPPNGATGPTGPGGGPPGGSGPPGQGGGGPPGQGGGGPPGATGAAHHGAFYRATHPSTHR